MDNSYNDELKGENIPDEIEERIYKFNGDEIIKKYVRGKFLGKGGFAKCFELRCLNNKKLYAAKIVSKQNLTKSSAKQKLKSEIKIHKSLFHQHIVKFEHVFEDNHNVYILLELCKNKTLNDILKKRKSLTEIETKYYFDQILKAVRFMHKNKIIHRDLKLGNLFISENMEIKIGDFGLATNIQYEGERKYTICGTPNYIAPEILEGKAVGHSYEVDFWAIGVIIYTLIIGRPPYETEDVKETYKRIQENNYSFPNHIYISDEARDFIEKILVMNPADRLNLEGMRNHPFMSNCTIPKAMPQYTTTFPPNSAFYRKLKSENIKNISDLSTLNDCFESHYDNLIKFSKRNLADVNRNNLVSDDLIFDKNIQNQLEQLNINNNEVVSAILNHNSNALEKNKSLNSKDNSRLNLTQAKEAHKIVNVKIKNIDLNAVIYINDIVDYSNDFGFIYKMNKNTIGVYFNDKSNIFKENKAEEFFYINKKAKYGNLKNIQKFNHVENSKDIPTEIRNKLEILKNYEQYINSESYNKNNHLQSFKEEVEKANLNDSQVILEKIRTKNEKNGNFQEKKTKTKEALVYMKNLFKAEHAFIIKLSNNNIQVIFTDLSFILIDLTNSKQVIYQDKNKRIQSYNIHLVNKATNKKFLKRYEYYKKIFYEKMEERLARKQRANNVNNSNMEMEENVMMNIENEHNKTH